MTEIDPHQQRIIIDTEEWLRRLERLAKMRRAADDAPSATERPAAQEKPRAGAGRSLSRFG